MFWYEIKVYKKGFTMNRYERNRNLYLEWSKKGKETLGTVKMYSIPHDAP